MYYNTINARKARRRAQSAATDLALHVGSGIETSLLELARTLAEVMGRADLLPEFRPERSVNPVPRRLASTEAARRELGFEAEISLPHGLGDLVAWWRGTQDAIEPVKAS